MLSSKVLVLIILSFLLYSSKTFDEKLFAGEVHYSRIPVEYWDHRIKTIKALGMNSLSVYIMWNYHEIEPGVFDWSTENKNLDNFLTLAQANNMSVLIRPGPYVCAEWDLGGLPSWLLKDGTAKMRQNDPTFLSHVKKYFQQLAPIFNKFDNKKTGGPIKLLQIQNQYGSYGNDLNYIQALRNIWSDLNITIQQYHADTSSNLKNSHWKGAVMGVNSANSESNYNVAKQLDPNVYNFGGEIYPGWMTHWGEKWAVQSTASSVNLFTFQVKGNHSFSMYMVHGGSNFGFTAGANQNSGASDYMGHVTSYDYDAPINEQGSTGDKFAALRNVFKQYADWDVPEAPAPYKMITIPAFKPVQYATLIDNIGEGINTTKFTYFQSDELKMYNQGIVVYEAHMGKGDYSFNATFRDFAIIFVNGTPTRTYDRSVAAHHIVNITCPFPICNLKILVEAMGHINYGKLINSDVKGIIKFDHIKGHNLTSLKMYKIPLTYEVVKSMNTTVYGNYPQLGSYKFDLEEIGDTYLNMNNFTKGYVWINGRNLGRYWKKGPQQKLFCPGVWLKEKDNQVLVLEMQGSGMNLMSGETTLKTQRQIEQFVEEQRRKFKQMIDEANQTIDIPQSLELELKQI